jgi:hypothetical protein
MAWHSCWVMFGLLQDVSALVQVPWGPLTESTVSLQVVYPIANPTPSISHGRKDLVGEGAGMVTRSSGENVRSQFPCHMHVLHCAWHCCWVTFRATTTLSGLMHVPLGPPEVLLMPTW